MSSEGQKKSPLRFIIWGVLGFGAVAGAALFLSSGPKVPAKKQAAPTIVNITLPPPSPPPPPPPPPQSEPPPPEEQQMVEAEPVLEEPPPEQAPTPDQPPAELTTNLGGGDGNGFGLTQGSGRGGFGTGGGNTIGGTGSKYGRFNGGLGRTVKNALERHASTRKATFPASRVAVWIDPSGLITRSRLLDSTGDSALDRAITSQVLPGTRYEAPPADMPLPIIIRISGRKP